MRKHAIRYTATGVVAVILVLALTFMVNWLGARHWKRADWTSSHIYTLSSKTLNILKSLKKDIRVVVFMTPRSGLYDQVHELLTRYASATDKLKVEYIDPDREPLKTRELAKQFGVSAANTVVFALGKRTKYVTSNQLADFDYSGIRMGQAPKMKAFKGEEQFTSAILSLVAPHVPKVYFITGHGEASLTTVVKGRSLAVLRRALKREDMKAAETSILSGNVPKDADVLAILGPTAAYTPVEITALDNYLKRGGRLLVCLDPLIERNGTMKSTRLEPLLKAHGVQVQNDLVIDPSHRLPFFDLSAVYLTDFGPHPITKGLTGMAVLFPVTRSVKPLTGDGWRASTLVSTSNKGWGETNLNELLSGRPVSLDAHDVKGPVAVGVAAEGKKGAKFRLVVYGDSDFLTDAQIANAGNMNLALNTFNWLASRQHLLGIAPRSVEQVNLFLTRSQIHWIVLITLLGMPLAAILFGIFVWRRRRH